MKRFNFLTAAIAVILTVTAVSCTGLREMGGDDYYDNAVRTNGHSRIYVEDPYRGTVVLEKDPYTGRYYEASPYGYSYGYRTANPYYRSTPYYRNNRYYRTTPVYRGNGNSSNQRYERVPNTSKPTQPPTKEQEQKREEVRKKILGGNN